MRASDGSVVPLSKRLDVPPLWGLGFLLLAVLLDRLVPVAAFGGWWSALAGAALIGGSAALIAWSAATFRRGETPIMPRRKPTALLTTGPFGLSRNPIYLGMLGIVAGAGLMLGSLGALVPAAFYWAVLRYRFIAGEEFHIRRNFGAEWDDYAARVRRWF